MEGKMTLYELTDRMAAIEDELYENGGELTPELETELTETKESLMAKVDNYNALYQKLGAMAASAKSEIERLTKIKRTAEKAQENLKKRLLWNMNVFGIEKLEGKLCKMSIRKSKALKVEEDIMLEPYKAKIDKLNSVLPPYMAVKVEISKKAISDAFKDTDVLPAGCERVQNESLQIR